MFLNIDSKFFDSDDYEDVITNSKSKYNNSLSNKSVQIFNETEKAKSNKILTNIHIKSLPLNLVSLQPNRTFYISLDTRYADKDFTKNSYKWNIFDVPSSYGLYIPENIKNIKSVKIYDFFMNTPNVNYIDDMQKLYILIDEFSSQSFCHNNAITKNKNNFHFYGKLQNSGDVNFTQYVGFKGGIMTDIGTNENLNRQSDGNNGLYEFAKPMKIPPSISITFSNTCSKIPIYQDKYALTFVNVARAVFSSGHNIPSSYTGWFKVYVNGFQTSEPILDRNLITIMNDKSGIFARYRNSTMLDLYDRDYNVVPTSVGSFISGATIYLTYFQIIFELEIKHHI